MGRVTLKHKQDPSIVWVSGIVKLGVFILPMCFSLHLNLLAFWPGKGSWRPHMVSCFQVVFKRKHKCLGSKSAYPIF